MVGNLKTKKQSGFTIIEVLIVLAIAGLIMLIVFLAVPALQRNSRNTQIRSAASAIAGAVTEYENNNNGAVPTAMTIAADGTVAVTGSGATAAGAKIQGGYTVGNGLGMLSLVSGNKCVNNAPVASARSVAITFNIESGTGVAVPQCVEA